MATNPIPHRLDDLFAFAEDAADGAELHETAIGIKQNDEAAIRADLAAAMAAEDQYQAGAVTKRNLYLAQRSADKNGMTFIGSASHVLGHHLGHQWSTAWSDSGFPNHSTAIPKSIGQRQTLLSRLQTYLTNHPTYENAGLNITAAQAGILFTAMSDTRSAVNAGLAAIGQKRVARDAARKALERRLRGLISELEQLLADDDPRWLAFGLNMPAADVTPEGPQDLVLSLGADGMVSADWHNVANADHYRLYVQVVGVNADFVAEPTTFADSDATLGPYDPGQTVRVKVTAVSGGLEGPPSDVAEILIANGNGGNGGENGVPAAPGAPTLTALVDGQVHAVWTAVPGAQFYTIYRQLVGTDLEYGEVSNVGGLFTTLTSLPPGEIVRVRLTASNTAGASDPGPHAEIETVA